MSRSRILPSTIFIASRKRIPVFSQNVCRCYSAKRPGFFSQFIDNIKQEMDKNKDMKENLKRFREEADRLEQSDALKSARHKFYSVESEASKSSEILKDRLGSVKDKLQDVMDEAAKTNIVKKASQIRVDLSKSARGVTDTITQKGQEFGKSSAFQSISQATSVVKEEISHQGISSRVYRSPLTLRKRIETNNFVDDRVFEANSEALGMELHADSKFYQSWENFKNNNTYVNKVLTWKTKFDESENPVIRASRLLTDKVSKTFCKKFKDYRLFDFRSAM